MNSFTLLEEIQSLNPKIALVKSRYRLYLASFIIWKFFLVIVSEANGTTKIIKIPNSIANSA